MLWLYAVAEAGRSLNAKGLERGRPVGFVIEHPAKTKESDSPSVETRRGSLWGSSLWKEFALEYGMTTVGFDQRAMGSPTTNRTTLGTNVYYLMGLDGLAPENSVEEPSTTTPSSSEWSPGLVRAIVMAMRFWIRHPRQAPVLAAFTPEQWKKHVDGNHADYRRDCLTCVMSRGTGRRHGRVRHPEMFSLTVDLAGPVKPGLDVTSKGTMGRGLKYMMVARYVLPKEYVRSYTTVGSTWRSWNGHGNANGAGGHGRGESEQGTFRTFSTTTTRRRGESSPGYQRRDERGTFRTFSTTTTRRRGESSPGYQRRDEQGTFGTFSTTTTRRRGSVCYSRR